jgi:hypothetical protein
MGVFGRAPIRRMTRCHPAARARRQQTCVAKIRVRFYRALRVATIQFYFRSAHRALGIWATVTPARAAQCGAVFARAQKYL